MAISAGTVWEVQSSGYHTNGGGFSASNSGSTGIDYSQNPDPYKTYGTLSGVGNTTLLCSSPDSFDDTVRGNIIFVSGQGRYCITAYNNSTNVTVDRNLGTFSFVSGAIGGAVGLPGHINTNMVAQNTCWVQSGYYYATGVAMSIPNTVSIMAYGVQRGDNGMAYFEASGMNASNSCFTIGDHGLIRNIIIANARLNGINGNNTQSCAVNCWVIGSSDNGFQAMQSVIRCYSSGCTIGVNANFTIGSTSVANRQHGIHSRYIIGCYVFNNSRQTNNTYNGIFVNSEGGLVYSCLSHGNGRQKDGISVTNKTAIINCICTNNNSYGINFAYTNPTEYAGAFNNACYSNTAGNFNNYPAIGSGAFNLTADPFVDAVNLNFALNSDNGGGSFIKGSGFNNMPLNLNTYGFGDIGPVQSAGSGDGGLISTTSFFSMIPNFNGGIL